MNKLEIGFKDYALLNEIICRMIQQFDQLLDYQAEYNEFDFDSFYYKKLHVFKSMVPYEFTYRIVGFFLENPSEFVRNAVQVLTPTVMDHFVEYLVQLGMKYRDCYYGLDPNVIYLNDAFTLCPDDEVWKLFKHTKDYNKIIGLDQGNTDLCDKSSAHKQPDNAPDGIGG